MVDSLPNLLCLDDEDITNKERGVARDVIELCSSNTGEHLLLSCLKITSKKIVCSLWTCRFDEFSYVGDEACFD